MKKNVIISIVSIVIIFIGILIFSNRGKSNNSILVEFDKITLNEHDIYTLKALTYPKEKEIKYTSSNSEIATIDEYGTIEALKEGNVILTVSSDNIKKEIDLIIKNDAPKATAITIKSKNNNLNVSDKYLLELQVFPIDALTPQIIFESTNEDVIKEESGFIKTLKQGSGQIEVKALVDELEITDAINIIVGEKESIEVKEISFYEEVATIKLNETYKLEPIIIPENTTNKDVVYTIEDDNIIEIENNIIKAKNNGETKVTATLGNKKAELIVKVKSSDGLTLNTEEISIAKGETYSLKSNFISSIDWYSSNNRIATVNNGVVKGVNTGEAIITIVNKYGKISKAHVNVAGNGIAVNNVTLSNNEIIIASGQNYQLSTSISPSNATNKELIYETSDNRIASVNDNGLVVGKLDGTCYITVYSSNNISDTVKVTVSKGSVALDSLEINPSSITIMKNDTYQLTATFIPSNATDNEIIWSSDNEKIVTVDNGLIKGLKTGTAIITARSNGLTSEIEVTVKNLMIDITSVDIKENNISLKEGEKRQLSIDYLPSNATNRNFVFKSDNSKVAVINNNGVITGISKGTATISATSTNGKSDSVKVIVDAKETQTDNGITDVIISSENVNLQIGEVKTVRATILPLDANQSVTWISNDENIVKVNDGTITAINNGNTTIAAIASNGMIARANVSVSYPPIRDGGSQLVDLNSDSLIVTMTKDDTTKMNIIRVWVRNPYEQFHKKDADGKPALISDIMNQEIVNRGLQNSILIGGNASFTYNNNASRGNLSITEGTVTKYEPGGPNSRGDGGNALFYSGIDENNKLKIYCTKPKSLCAGRSNSYEAEDELFKQIINDGVKNTMIMPFECIMVVDGQPVRDPGWMNRYAIRHTFCQVNTNNFIITISTKGNTLRETSNLQAKLGCVTGINLDGGGSAKAFYKAKGSSYVTMIRSTSRPRPEAVYFSEY